MAVPSDRRWLTPPGLDRSTAEPAGPVKQLEPNGPRFPLPVGEEPEAIHEPPPLIHTETQASDGEQEAVIRTAPPWLASSIAHMVLLLVLALLILPRSNNQPLQLEAIFSDKLGQQLDEDVVEMGDQTDPPEITEDSEDPEPIEDPESDPTEAEPDTEADATHEVSPVRVEAVGRSLEGRAPGSREKLLAAYGGNQLTEEAVIMGLEWLKRQQLRDGRWSLSGPYSNGARNENMLAATSMALLAFQGHGDTHKNGTYKRQVQRGIDQLLKMQSETGDFWQKGSGRVGDDRLYAQAQGTIALCELYAMSRDEKLRGPAQQAIDYAVRIQDAQGGWRYDPGSGSDTSVTGWFVMALQSATMGDLNVPDETLAHVRQYLDLATDGDGILYAYKPGAGAETPMTAEALLCRQYLGWEHDDARLQAGVAHLAEFPIDWNNQNVYYWYYATQVMHHMGGEVWREWNGPLRTTMPARQEQTGKERGSWSPVGDQWGAHGGRLYTTCLSIYMLEVYYRHLPLYSLPAERTDDSTPDRKPLAAGGSG